MAAPSEDRVDVGGDAAGRRRIVDAWTSLVREPGAAEPRATISVFDVTDLSAVQAERDRLASIIRSAPDPIISVSKEGRITSWNPAAEKLYGHSAHHALGRGFELYVPREGLEEVRAAAARIIETGCTMAYEQSRRRADGSPVEVRVVAFPTYDSSGNVTGSAGIARELTEQREIERKLEAERQYSRSLVDSSLHALLVGDSSLVLTEANRAATSLTGYSRKELVGIQLASLFARPERARQVMQEALEKGSVHEVELELMTRQAHRVTVSLNASACHDAQGVVSGLLISARDIAERKRTESERSWLAAIVSSSGDAIYSVTPDLVVGTWNAGAERLFGYKGAEIIGRSAQLLVPLDLRAELAEYLERVTRGESLSYETRRLRSHGSAIDVAIVASPIFGAEGRLSGISVVARDISERKRIERELTEARDAALQSVEERSRFLANMSHEIRTPLNSIIGMTGLLLDTELRAGQLELARDVHDGGEILLGLVDDILDFSKITAGRLAFEETGFELVATVEAAVEGAAGRARRKGLELTTLVDPDAPPLLRGDPGRLRQALLNLLNNAVKFTERGSVTLRVGKISASPVETVLRFEVHDTGIGIAKDKLSLLFKPFSQIDSSTTRHFGGTGLGLSLTRELVERMHGDIGVTSTDGAGSTFWFTARFATQAGGAQSEPFPSLAGRRVLIVDGDQSSREILARQVAEWGMASEAVDGAGPALEALRQVTYGQRFDVALVDLMMPKTDGIQLARKISADPALAGIPLIIVSPGEPMCKYGEPMRGVEISGWLTKPIAQSPLYNELASAVARVYRKRGRAAAPPNTHAIGPSMAVDMPAQKPRHSEIANALAARRLRVLVAEDNPINQRLARLQLKRLATHTDMVGDGREAVEAVMRGRYDIVLMDCQMPEMDGYEATREIRRREGARHHTKIVAVTAHALVGDREKCLAAGMDDYLSKPVKLEALEAVLARVLNLGSSDDAEDRPCATTSPHAYESSRTDLLDGASQNGEATGVASATVILHGTEHPPAGSASQARGSLSDLEVDKMELLNTDTYAPVLDRETLAELRSEGDDLLTELFEMFLAEAPASLEQITRALERGDLKAAGLQAHRLKGSAAGLGAKRMQHLCGEIEQAARANQVGKARVSFDELASEGRRVLEAIRTERVAAANGAVQAMNNGRPH